MNAVLTLLGGSGTLAERINNTFTAINILLGGTGTTEERATDILTGILTAPTTNITSDMMTLGSQIVLTKNSST